MQYSSLHNGLGLGSAILLLVSIIFFMITSFRISFSDPNFCFLSLLLRTSVLRGIRDKEKKLPFGKCDTVSAVFIWFLVNQ